MASTSAEVPDFGKVKVILNNGFEMPVVGIGTYRVRTSEDIFTLVDNALMAGYRLFDTAAVYGNEVYLGQALRQLLPKYGLEREDIFITTKLSVHIAAPADHGAAVVPRAFAKSLANLGLDYIDMYMIHFPGAAKLQSHSPKNAQLRAESWRAMEVLYDDGKVNAIGVCNFTVAHLADFAANHSSVPVVNQVEFHPFYKQEELLQYCKSQYIGVQAYCSLGGAAGSGGRELREHPVVEGVARAHDASAAQALLLWALQQDVAVIPKSTSPEHIRQNIKLDFRLTDDEMKVLHNLLPTKKFAWDPSTVI